MYKGTSITYIDMAEVSGPVINHLNMFCLQVTTNKFLHSHTHKHTQTHTHTHMNSHTSTKDSHTQRNSRTQRQRLVLNVLIGVIRHFKSFGMLFKCVIQV